MRGLVMLTVVVLGVASAAADVRPAAARGRVAQAPDPLAAVERATAAVAKAEASRAAIAGERATLARRYDGELVQIEKLKRQKASWRRDRALRAQLAASLETARALDVVGERLRRADADVSRARAAAVVAIDRALPRIAAGPRRTELARLRRLWVPPPRKIRIPDEKLDPLADPEELDLQAAALRDVETQLAREVEELEEQAARFDHMARLRKQHERAGELARRDDADPRRIGVAARGTALDGIGGAAAPEGAFDEDRGPSAADDLGDSHDFATALSEVVDPSTVDALRRAETSNDPATRAAVARRARDAVNQRLEKLRKHRAAIESHARSLRRP